AILMPWRLKSVYETSPLARWKVLGLPMISVAGFVFAAFLAVNLVLSMNDDIYSVNNHSSLVYMAALYAVAIGIYAVAAVIRHGQGMGLEVVQREIPVE